MWRDDNNKIEKIFMDFSENSRFPVECPLCRKISAHIYMHKYDNETRRGGLWVWCDSCKTFSHAAIYVPNYWSNISSINEERLFAIPDYLNEIRDIIDTHVNYILDNMGNRINS